MDRVRTEPEQDPSAGSLLAYRGFAAWLGCQFTSNLGYAAWSISVLWLAYQISGSLLLAALVLFLQYGIYALTFVAGPFADRALDKRTVFLVVLPLQAGIAALLGLAIAEGRLSTGLLLGAVAATAVLDDFWWTTGNTVPRILVGRENLLRANGLQSALVGVGSLVGYGAGALLLVEVGPAGGAFLRAGMLALSVGCVLAVNLRSAPSARRGLLRDLADGWSILGRSPGRPLLQIGALFAAEGFFLGAPLLLITLFANREFGASSFAYGLLFTTYMVGSIASGLAVGRWNPRRFLGPLLVGATVAEGAAVLAAVALLPSLLPSAAVWFLVGFAAGVPSPLLYAYLQAVAPADAVGRVVADFEMFPAGASAFGAVAMGLLATALDPSGLAGVIGLGLVAVGAVAAAIPVVRRMRF